MKSMKWNKICRRGYPLVLAAGLLIPGISQAAIVSGETTQATSAGDISVAMTVDDLIPLSRLYGRKIDGSGFLSEMPQIQWPMMAVT